MLKLLVTLAACLVATECLLVDTRPVQLTVRGVPVQLVQEGDHYVIRDLVAPRDVTSVAGVIVPSVKVEANQYVVPSPLPVYVFNADQIPHSVLLEDHQRTKRGVGFSYTAPGGTSRSEYVDSYTDPRTRSDDPLNRITGRVSWTSPEGIPFTLNYVADGTGFHPEGNHLPSSPLHKQYFPR